MHGDPNDFWGKLKKNDLGAVEQWHPLVDHCADVAACFEALAECTLLGRRLAHLAGLRALTRVQVARMGVVSVLHDLGKTNLGFWHKCLRSPPFTAGHVREVLALFSDAAGEAGLRLFDALPCEELTSWGPDNAAAGLLLAAIGHHGRPFSQWGHKHEPHLWKASRGLDPFACVRRLVGASRRWFPEAWVEGGEPLPVTPAFQHAFAGLVMLADWLGSDTDIFPYSEPGAGDRITFARGAARRALRLIGLDTGPSRASLGAEAPGFGRISEHKPNAVQKKLLELALPAPGTVDVLEAETGSGKTEAAIAHFARLFHAGLVDGMYFALPTRTAATQIFVRTRKAIERVFLDEAARPPAVLAVPGYLQVDDATGKRLPGFEVLWNDVDSERFRFRGWAAENPKRYLAGAIAIGTIDQVLLSALQVSHAHLRATSLLRQLLVVDEVHASDAYMTRLLEHVLKYHVAAGGHALLMSATLGSVARNRLLRAAAVPTLEDACSYPYPAITRTEGASFGPVPVAQADERTKAVAIEIEPLMGDAEAVAILALRAAEEGAKVLLLRNTVKACVDTHRKLEGAAKGRGIEELLFSCKGALAPHHARFAADDRRALDEAVEASFGKSESRPQGGCVVVATQTVQQSLDLDADLLITDLCPMDVLLQRIGRLHRHLRERPAGFEVPRCVVLRPAERDLGAMLRADGTARGICGLGSVYDDLRIIESTLRELEARQLVVIPADNRTLVERTTHPEALGALVREPGGAWAAHEARCLGGAATQRKLAALMLVRRDVGYGHDDVAFPEGELASEIKTRLGEGDRVVSFEAPLPPGPFGKPVPRLNVPAWQAHDLDGDAVVVTEAGADRFTFDFGKKAFVYDRLGLRALDPQAEVDEKDTADA